MAQAMRRGRSGKADRVLRPSHHRRMMRSDSRSCLQPVVGLAALVATGVAAAPSAYLGLLTCVAWRASRARRQRRRPTSSATKFAVCIPAHDEESTIERAVRALRAQSYDSSDFAIHVVADNCRDSTAAIAQSAGAFVHRRDDAENPGKGAALNWLTDQLAHHEFDVLVVIDADTEAAPDFLAALDRSFATGTVAAQGYYAVAQSDASPAIGLRFAAIACRHHLRPLARTALGASAGLYGNGMAFRRDLLTGRRWTNHLIEDAEFQIDLLLDGHRVTYVPDAVVRAEMPASFGAATSQNERWELGRAQLARRFVPILSRRVVSGGPVRRVVYADAVADQLTPPLTVLALVDMVAATLGLASLFLSGGREGRSALVLGIAATLTLPAHVLVGLRLVDAPAEVYRSFRSAPSAVLWKLRLLMRIARRPSGVAWTRTARNATIGSRS